jgi:hypothetical protein
VWTAHFFSLYAVASIWPGETWTWLIVIAATLLAVAANLLILTTARSTRTGDAVDQYLALGARLGAMVSLVAVTWQAMPALVV